MDGDGDGDDNDDGTMMMARRGLQRSRWQVVEKWRCCWSIKTEFLSPPSTYVFHRSMYCNNIFIYIVSISYKIHRHL